MAELGQMVREALEARAVEWGVRLLLVAEGGSRAAGLAHPTSDLDVRFVYARPLREYLSISPSRRSSLNIRATSIIELPRMEGVDEAAGVSVELDMFGWDVDKALGLLRESNPALLDWLRSPIVYYADEAFYTQAMALARKHFQPRALTHHYINMAKKHDKLYFENNKGPMDVVSLKKYFYIIRPLLSVEWMRARTEEGKALPPSTFDELTAGVAVPDDVWPLLSQLVQQKRQGELGKGRRLGELDRWIERLFERAALYAEAFPGGKNDTPIDEFDELLLAVLCPHKA